MRETRTSGLMSGEGKRGDTKWKATAPFLDSTNNFAGKIGELDPDFNAIWTS